MKITLTCLLLLSGANSVGQVLGRLYYNHDWVLTTRDSSVYFRTGLLDTVHMCFAGEVRDYTKNGKLIMKGVYKGCKKEGKFTFYHANGRVASTGVFTNNIRTGNWEYFYPNGRTMQEVAFEGRPVKVIYFNDSLGASLMTEGNGRWFEEYEEAGYRGIIVNEGKFKNYKRDGEWSCHLKGGRVLFVQQFKEGEFLQGTVSQGSGTVEMSQPVENWLLPHYKFDATEGFRHVRGLTKQDYPFVTKLPGNAFDEIYSVVEVSAEPIGGMQTFYNAIMREIQYPKDARKNGVQGRVFIEFVINADGTLSDFKVIKGIGGGCDEEALRLMSEVAKKVKWKPGTQRGKNVRQRYTLPIVFKLGK